MNLKEDTELVKPFNKFVEELFELMKKYNIKEIISIKDQESFIRRNDEGNIIQGFIINNEDIIKDKKLYYIRINNLKYERLKNNGNYACHDCDCRLGE